MKELRLINNTMSDWTGIFPLPQGEGPSWRGGRGSGPGKHAKIPYCQAENF